MFNTNEGMGAPWWHYATSILVGWAMAAFMYT